MVKQDPYDEEPPHTYECVDCGVRLEADTHPGECVECGGNMQNIDRSRPL